MIDQNENEMVDHETDNDHKMVDGEMRRDETDMVNKELKINLEIK